MKCKFFSSLLVSLVMSGTLCADNIWTDGGFEGSLGWNPVDNFVAATIEATDGAAINGATFFTLVHDDLITESGKWIEDPTRAYEGNRMFWLRPYNDPDTICVGHRYNNVLTAGQTYELSFKFAAFDEGTPAGSTATTKPVTEVMAWDPTLGTSGEFVTTELPITFSDGQTRDPVTNTYVEYEVQDWDNLNWMTATSTFTAPEANGQAIYVWTSMTNDSNGILLDGITLQAVPEPATGIFALAFIGAAVARRRRQ